MSDKQRLVDVESGDSMPPPYNEDTHYDEDDIIHSPDTAYPPVLTSFHSTEPLVPTSAGINTYPVDESIPPPAYISTFARFPEDPKWTNTWMLAFFLVNTLASFFSCIWSIKMFVRLEQHKPVDMKSIDMYGPTFGRVLAMSIGFGVLFSLLFTQLARTHPLQLLYFSFWGTVSFLVVTALPCFFHPATIMIGLLLLLSAGCCVWWYKSRRDLFEFTGVAMRVGTHALAKHPVYWAVFAMMLVQWTLSVYYLVAIVGTTLYASSDHNNRTYNILAFYQVASMLWLLEVMKNVVHTTVAGTIGRYYFSLTEASGAGRKSFVYALTKGLGAISFGSLLITLVRILRAMAQSNNSREDNALLMVVRFISACILSCVEGMLEAFNYFAFVHVAIYGVDYVTAGKGVMEMIRRSGVDGLMNNTLTGMVTTCVVFSSGILSGLFALLVFYVSPVNNAENEHIMANMYAAAFFTGLIVTGTAVGLVMGTLESAVTALFVCFTDEPNIMAEIDPEFNQYILSGVALAKEKEGSQRSNLMH